MLQGILLATIVILLLVVLVPVGIALFQRLKPEKQAAPPRERERERPGNVPVPPTSKNMRAIEIPTDKVLPRTPPDIAAPPPPRAPEPSVGATRMEPLPQVRPPVQEAQGTEMVQWYGLLNCTAGPLEGQRFVVEEDGFYIGRDPVLSKVVVNDTRVSKRHVRILPRDGKVWAIDEGSTNGTYLASAPGNRITEVQLKRGDTLILGDNAAVFVYQI